jgi:hypothetical protein
MLDEKLQVWKCSNELNPYSCNWTMTKITMFNNLVYKKFMVPSMSYDDYSMTSNFNRLECFSKIGIGCCPSK